MGRVFLLTGEWTGGDLDGLSEKESLSVSAFFPIAITRGFLGVFLSSKSDERQNCCLMSQLSLESSVNRKNSTCSSGKLNSSINMKLMMFLYKVL